MFRWLFLKLESGYNMSFLGSFMHNAQVMLRKAWDNSALGIWVKGKEEVIPIKNYKCYRIPENIKNSKLLQ